MEVALYDGTKFTMDESLEIPTIGVHDALIKVKVAGICVSDLNNYAKTSATEQYPQGMKFLVR